MSDEGKRPILIPGGEKLLMNVRQTGASLMQSLDVVKAHEAKISKEQLIEILEGHAAIGEVMVEAVVRVRKAMGHEEEVS